MKQLIITADDYGMSEAVNRAILEGIDNGVITATNVMMNMPLCGDTERLRGKKASIGIHWTLTCGDPVLPPEKIPSLTDRDGRFYPLVEFRRLYNSGKIEDTDIEMELTAQYEKYRGIWGEADYWNTHEHVHLGPRIFRVFLKTAASQKICRMRSNNRIYVPAKSGKFPGSLLWTLLEPAKRTVFAYMRKKAVRKGILSPDGRICCLDKNDIHDAAYILPHIQWGNHNTAEFTIHPATECDSPFFGDMTENRLEEYRMVTDSQFQDIAKKAGIELITFNDIR